MHSTVANDLLKETVKRMIYKNLKGIVHSLARDSNFFDIIAGVLQPGTLVPFLLIICFDYKLRT